MNVKLFFAKRHFILFDNICRKINPYITILDISCPTDFYQSANSLIF